MFKKVLLLSASSGAGHLRAAQALEKAFLEMRAAQEVRHVDTLDYTTKVFRDLYSKAYINAVNKAPELLGWLYDQFDKPWKNERRRLALDKLNTRPFVKLLREYQPEIVVCTHFLPAEIISWLREKDRLDCRQSIVITDFDVHAFWLYRHFEQYFVALEETKVHLEKLGVPGTKITVSGIPIDPVFARSKDRIAMREKHGLEPGLTTILVSSGGFGVGRIQNLMQSLLQIRHPVQVVIICGRNEKLKAGLDSMLAKLANKGSVSVVVVGYTDEMDEYMAASDIVVGKPGGLTTSEALAKGLIFVVVNPIPGQEERNADHLLEEGAAIRCNNLPTLAYKVDRLLDDPEHMARMRQCVQELARPDAAKTIVNKLLELKPCGGTETSAS
jgi:processive 1,2-diacylglycerol beta-glucosyltransferase